MAETCVMETWYHSSSKMKLPHRRQFLHLAAGAAALPAVSSIASAQAYPARPVRRRFGRHAPFRLAADFGKLIAAETEKWAKVIRAANIKPE